MPTLATRSLGLATDGLTCTGTYLIVVVFQGRVLGRVVLDLDLGDRIEDFALLLVEHVSYQAVPLDVRYV